MWFVPDQGHVLMEPVTAVQADQYIDCRVVMFTLVGMYTRAQSHLDLSL